VNYLEVKNRIESALPFPAQGLVKRQIVDSFRARQLGAAAMNAKGWPFLKRTEARRNDGGYDTGSVEVAQGSRAVTGTGTTWEAKMLGWRFAPQGGETEIYDIATTAASAFTLDRPYEGESDSGLEYRVWDPYITAPSDLHAWQSIGFEAGGRQIGHASLGVVRGVWPDPRSFGSAILTCLGPPSTDAKYSTGTVAITAASATVTLSAGTWPEDVVGHHLRFGDESPLYRVKSRDSDTGLTLFRNYGGNIAASGLSYELDPPGAIRIEVNYPQEDRYALKIEYFCIPEELVNDADPVEGEDLYQSCLCDLAIADVLESNIDAGSMEQEMVQALFTRARTYRQRGQSGLVMLMRGETPAPERDMVMKDCRYGY